MSETSSTQTASRPVALVTGGTRGIGLGIARALARDRWNLALSGVRPPEDIAARRRRAASRAAAGSSTSPRTSPAGRSRALARRTGVAARLRRRQRARQQRRPRAARAQRPPRRERRQLRRADANESPGTCTSSRRMPRDHGGSPRRPTASFRASIVFVTSVSAEMASLEPRRVLRQQGRACRWRRGSSRCASRPAAFPSTRCAPESSSTDMTAGVQAAYDQRIADGLVPERRWGTPDDVGRVGRGAAARRSAVIDRQHY